MTIRLTEEERDILMELEFGSQIMHGTFTTLLLGNDRVRAVSPLAFQMLCDRHFIDTNNHMWYVITPAGRAALAESEAS